MLYMLYPRDKMTGIVTETTQENKEGRSCFLIIFWENFQMILL